MSATLRREAHGLYNGGKTPYGPFTFEPMMVTSDDPPLGWAPEFGCPPRVTVPVKNVWTIKDRNGKRIATVYGSEETARMFSLLPDLLDSEL